MGLCLTMHVNLRMSLQQAKYALKKLYNINISHQQVANYCKTATICIKPFDDNYDYGVKISLLLTKHTSKYVV